MADKDWGKLDHKYPDCEIYRKDVGELPDKVQHDWFILWDGVIAHKFQEWYNTKKGNDPWDYVDYRFDKNTGNIVVYTDEGKDIFKTIIKGVKTTRVKNGKVDKVTYDLYPDKHYQDQAKFDKESMDSVEFEYRGSKNDSLEESLDRYKEYHNYSYDYNYSYDLPEKPTQEAVVEELKKFANQMGFTELIEGLPTVKISDYYNAEEEGKDSYGWPSSWNTRWKVNVPSSFIIGESCPEFVENGVYQVVLRLKIDHINHIYPFWEQKGFTIYATSNYSNYRNGDHYRMYINMELGGEQYPRNKFMTELPKVIAVLKDLDKVKAAYPDVFEKSLSCCIRDTGSNAVVWHLVGNFNKSVFGTNAENTANMIKNANSIMWNNSRTKCYFDVPLSSAQNQLRKNISVLCQMIQADAEHFTDYNMSLEGEGWKITANPAAGTTNIYIEGEYYPLAIRKVLGKLSDSLTVTRNENEDQVIQISIPWNQVSADDLKEGLLSLKSFLNNPRNKKKKIPSYDRSNWGIIWNKTPTNEQLKSTMNYFVFIKDNDRGEFDGSIGSYGTIGTRSGSTLGPRCIYINPFWFLKQGRGYQLAILKRALEATRFGYDPMTILKPVINQCRIAIEAIQKQGFAPNFREKKIIY